MIDNKEEVGDNNMRKKSSIFKKRGMLIAMFVLLVAGISFGYAALSTTLTINGKTNISKVGWDIHFFDAKVTEGSVSGTEENAIINSSDRTKANWTATLANPGDFYEFTIKVGNFGTIDAKLDTLPDDPSKKYVISTESVKYADGTQLSEEDKEQLKRLLSYTVTGTPADKLAKASGSTPTSYELKFRVEFNKDIIGEDLFDKVIEIDYTYELKYVQDK